MSQSDFYDLPTLVGEQYMLSSVLRETRDTILYRGTQKDLRREVIVECLRPSAVDNQRKTKLFLDSAKAQARFHGDNLTSVLEVMQDSGTWLVAKANPAGEPLDMMLSDGKLLSSMDLCQLMIILCTLCLRLDTERVASARFHLEDVSYHRHQFCLNNPARAGSRAASSSRLFLSDAARDLLPLLDADSKLAGSLVAMLKRLCTNYDDSPMLPALFLAEFSRLHTLLLDATESAES